jgi:hypothetical protein
LSAPVWCKLLARKRDSRDEGIPMLGHRALMESVPQVALRGCNVNVAARCNAPRPSALSGRSCAHWIPLAARGGRGRPSVLSDLGETSRSAWLGLGGPVRPRAGPRTAASVLSAAEPLRPNRLALGVAGPRRDRAYRSHGNNPQSGHEQPHDLSALQ